MDSYRNKYSSRHHESRHHKQHRHRHRHHHYRYDDEGEYESHRVHPRHHSHRSSDEDDYQYSRRVPSQRIEKPPSPAQIRPVKRPATPPPPPSVPVIEKPKEPNWKLMVDPFITKAPTKVYRYDGVVANDSSYPEVIVQDPRTYKSKNKTITLPIELTVPKFKVCINLYIIINKKLNL